MEPKTTPHTTLRIKTLPHLANQLRISPNHLVTLAENASSKYRNFTRQCGGKKRQLIQAIPPLHEIQSNILRRILSRIPASEYAFGGMKGRSIRDNAQAHAAANYIAKLDIRNFYPSIHHTKIYDFFIDQECSPDVSRVLTQLTTYKYKLPLGVSTSPLLANLIVRPIDIRIGGLAKKYNINYTRYVDDITISAEFDIKRFCSQVHGFIQQTGFEVKTSKNAYFTPDDKKERTITGVRIRRDGKLSAPIDYIDSLQEDLLQAKEQAAQGRVERLFDHENQYLGRIHFVRWLDKNTGNKLLGMHRKVNWRRLEKAIARY